MIDILVILVYFAVVMVVGVMARSKADSSAEEYFISSRSLKWPSIALSTIATNIHAGHFLGMAGSAYLYGLAQANLEINAVFGILMAAFVFVPLYLNLRVMTITQFFEKKFGARVATAYSVLTMVLYGFLYLGTTLFWGAYAVSKFATEGFMQVLASELEKTSKVRVNSLNPGATNTAMRRTAYPGERPTDNPSPEDIMSTYLYLMGDDSAGITGQAFNASW